MKATEFSRKRISEFHEPGHVPEQTSLSKVKARLASRIPPEPQPHAVAVALPVEVAAEPAVEVPITIAPEMDGGVREEIMSGTGNDDMPFGLDDPNNTEWLIAQDGDHGLMNAIRNWD